MHSGLDPGVFLLHLLVVHIYISNSAALYCSLGVSTIMPTVLLMNLTLISILCTNLTLQTKTYSLVNVCVPCCMVAAAGY